MHSTISIRPHVLYVVKWWLPSQNHEYDWSVAVQPTRACQPPTRNAVRSPDLGPEDKYRPYDQWGRSPVGLRNVAEGERLYQFHRRLSDPSTLNPVHDNSVFAIAKTAELKLGAE